MKKNTQCRMRQLKDEGEFKLRDHPKAATYVLNHLDHKKKTGVFTSESSGRTYTRSWNTVVY